MALSSAAAAVGSLAAAAPSPRPGVPSRRGCSLNITRHPIASQRLAPAVRSTPLAEPRGRIVVSMAMGRRAIFANNAELEALEKFKQITSVISFPSLPFSRHQLRRSLDVQPSCSGTEFCHGAALLWLLPSSQPLLLPPWSSDERTGFLFGPCRGWRAWR